VRGRGEAGTGTIAGDLARRSAAWVEEYLRILIGCMVIFAIGIGFGIAFRVARSDGHPHPTTVVTVDRGTTVGTGGGSSSP
jgi:Na+-driven multidrug efflux pump